MRELVFAHHILLKVPSDPRIRALLQVVYVINAIAIEARHVQMIGYGFIVLIQVMWAIGMSRLIVLIQMEKIMMGNVQTVPYCTKV